MSSFKQSALIISHKITPVSTSITGDLSVIARDNHLRVYNNEEENTLIYTSEVAGLSAYLENRIENVNISGSLIDYTLLTTTSEISAGLQSQIDDIVSINNNQADQIAELSANNLNQDTLISSISSSLNDYTLLTTTSNISSGFNTRIGNLESSIVGITGGISQLDTRFVNISGDVMTGPLIINYDSSGTEASLQINADGDAHIRLNNPLGGQSYSELSFADNNSDDYGIYSISGGKEFGIYDYSISGNKLTFASVYTQISDSAGESLLYGDEDLILINANMKDYDTYISTYNTERALSIQSSTTEANEYVYVGIGNDASTSGSGAFRVRGGASIDQNLVIAGIAGTTGNIVTHDSNGKLLDSGINITSISGDYVNIAGDTMTGNLFTQKINFVDSEAQFAAVSGSNFIMYDGYAKSNPNGYVAEDFIEIGANNIIQNTIKYHGVHIGSNNALSGTGGDYWGVSITDNANINGYLNIVIGSSAYCGDANTPATSNTIVANEGGVDGGVGIAVAIGTYSYVTGNGGVAVGYYTEANQDAIAIGNNTKATGINSIAIGTNITNAVANTVVVGDSNITNTTLRGDVRMPYSTVDSISGLNGSIVTHDISGRLFDSGILATSLATNSTLASISGGLDIRIDSLEEIVTKTGEPRGFENRTDSTIAFNESNRTFSITGNYNIWQNGIKYAKTGESYQIPNTTGLYYFRYNSSAVFQDSTTPWSILTDVPIAYVYWDATNQKGVLFEERHGIVMDSVTHEYLHLTQGTKAEIIGSLSNYNLQEAVPTISGQQFSIGASTIADEDITTTTSSLSDGGPYTIIYRSGTDAEWIISTGNTLPFISGTSYIAYNQLNGSTWQLTDLSTNNTYVNYYLAVVPAVSATYQNILIPGQNVSTTLAAAQSLSLANMDLSGIPFVEMVAIYRLTYRYNSSYSTNRGRLEAVSTLNTNIITSGITPSTIHNSLSGLQGGTTNEYYHLTAAQNADWIGKTEVSNISGYLYQNGINIYNILQNEIIAISGATFGITGGISQLDERFVNISGDTMTGPLVISYDSTSVSGASLQVNADGDARIRLNNPLGGQSWSELSFAANNIDKYGIYTTSVNSFGIYDYNLGQDRLELYSNYTQIRDPGGNSILYADEDILTLNIDMVNVDTYISTYNTEWALRVQSSVSPSAEYVYVGISNDASTSGSGAFRVRGGASFDRNLVIAGIAGTNGNIVTHDANGKLLDSGINITSISGDYVNVTGDTMTGQLKIAPATYYSWDSSSDGRLLNTTATLSVTAANEIDGFVGSRNKVTFTSTNKTISDVTSEQTYITLNNASGGSISNVIGKEIYIEASNSTAKVNSLESILINAYDAAGSLIVDNKGINIEYLNATTDTTKSSNSCNVEGLHIDFVETYDNGGNGTGEAKGIYLETYQGCASGSSYGTYINSVWTDGVGVNDEVVGHYIDYVDGLCRNVYGIQINSLGGGNNGTTYGMFINNDGLFVSSGDVYSIKTEDYDSSPRNHYFGGEVRISRNSKLAWTNSAGTERSNVKSIETTATSASVAILDTESVQTACEYLIKASYGTNLRITKIIAVTNGTDVNYQESQATDFGIVPITYSLDYSSGIRLKATIMGSDTWTIKVHKVAL